MSYLFILAVMGIIYFAWDHYMESVRDLERQNRMREAAKHKEQAQINEEAELRLKKDEAQKKMIDLQKSMIDLLEQKIALVENPSIPSELLGFQLVREYDLVNVFIPDSASFSSLEIGSQLYARQAKDNPYDDNAISLNLDGSPVAFLYRGKLQDMANDYIERGDIVHAVVTYLNPAKKHGAVYLGFYSAPNSVE